LADGSLRKNQILFIMLILSNVFVVSVGFCKFARRREGRDKGEGF
jgi:hypothetical protein